MDYALIIFILTGALFNVGSAQTRQYYFVNTSLNWTEAQSFCRQVYTDLATLENTDDVSAAVSTSNYTGKAWIGLYDDLINSWRWSLTDNSYYGEGETEFRNWYTQQPNNLRDEQYCVELFSGSPYFGTWGDSSCSLLRPFVCYNGTVNGTATFVSYLSMSKNWTEAQRYCRENHIDLASIRNQTENEIITNLANGFFVWIGLYREKLWSDGSMSLFRHWADGQPDIGAEQCVTAAFNDSGRWSDDDCSLSFPFICHQTIVPNAENFRPTGQDETFIILQWDKVNNNVNFILQYNEAEVAIAAPDGDGPVTHTVSSLISGTRYTFTLFSVFGDIRSSGVNIIAVTAPPNAENFRPTGQDESSITLQWDKVNSNVSFILQYNGAEINISAPDLYGIDEFSGDGQDETSITAQWDPVNSNVSFNHQHNGTDIIISAPDGDGPVTHTVSSLTAGTQYTFTLFSVFESIRSSGVNAVAVTATGSQYVVGLNIRLKSSVQLSASDLEDLLTELLVEHGLSPHLFSLKLHSVKT